MKLLKNNSRPKLLTWLCIGSAAFGVLWIIMFIFLIIFSKNGNVPPGIFPGLVTDYLQAGYLFVISLILLAGIGITGVAMMWQMKKIGFYVYAFAKAAIYFLPVVFIGYQHLTFPGLIITSILIIIYGIIITKK